MSHSTAYLLFCWYNTILILALFISTCGAMSILYGFIMDDCIENPSQFIDIGLVILTIGILIFIFYPPKEFTYSFLSTVQQKEVIKLNLIQVKETK